jgi:hypothetical protein
MAWSLRLEEETKWTYERGVYYVAVDNYEVPCIGCLTVEAIVSGSILSACSNLAQEDGIALDFVPDQ